MAVGGDLSPERLLYAYGRGVFPWYDEEQPLLWWSPDPRAVFELDGFHLSHSLRRELKKGHFRVTFDQAFTQVMVGCAEEREGGTWILPEMVEAYGCLHRQGHAHSFEVWLGEELVGGLYGVQVAGLFAAESMFHRSTNASKVALAYAVGSLFAAGITLFDVQFSTPHLASLGVRVLSRTDYLDRLELARAATVDLKSLVLTFPQ